MLGHLTFKPSRSFTSFTFISSYNENKPGDNTLKVENENMLKE